MARVKVQRKKLVVQRKFVKSSTQPTGLKPYPQITFGGKWLEEAGIAYGDVLKVEITEKGLILTK